MIGLLSIVTAAPWNQDSRLFAPTPLRPLARPLVATQLPTVPRAPSAFADLGRVDRDAMMQQLHAELNSSLKKLDDSEVNGLSTIRRFFAVLATGFSFFVAYVATTMRARRPATTLRSVTRAGPQPRMAAEEWSDKDYQDMW